MNEKKMEEPELKEREGLLSKIEGITGIYSLAWCEFSTNDLRRVHILLTQQNTNVRN